MTQGSATSGIRIEFQSLAVSERYPTGHAWGELCLWIGDSLVWGEREESKNTPIIWSWVEFLEGIARIWPWLTLEEAYALLNEWVLNERLKVHMKQVGHLMKAYALEQGLDAFTAHLR